MLISHIMIMFKTRDKFEIDLHIESNGDYCFRQSFNLWGKTNMWYIN